MTVAHHQQAVLMADVPWTAHAVFLRKHTARLLRRPVFRNAAQLSNTATRPAPKSALNPNVVRKDVHPTTDKVHANAHTHVAGTARPLWCCDPTAATKNM